MTNPLTAEELAQRKEDFRKVFSEVGLNGVNFDYFIKKQISPEFIAARLGAMKQAGVPLKPKGITFKLSLSKKKFDELLERFRSKYKFSSIQQDMYDYLKRKGVSESVAVSLCKHKQPTRLLLEEKIKYFEGIRLNPTIYGEEKIPVSVYEKFLHYEFAEIKDFRVKSVLREVANYNAIRRLNALFPGWRKDEIFRARKPYLIWARYLLGKAQGKKITLTFLTSHPVKKRVPVNISKAKRILPGLMG